MSVTGLWVQTLACAHLVSLYSKSLTVISHVLKCSLFGEIITNVFVFAWHWYATHATGVSGLFSMSTSPLLNILLFSCLLVLGCTRDRKLWTERAEAAAAGPGLMVAQLFSVMEVLLKLLLVGGVSTQQDLLQPDFHWTHFLCSAPWACAKDHIQYGWLSQSCCFFKNISVSFSVPQHCRNRLWSPLRVPAKRQSFTFNTYAICDTDSLMNTQTLQLHNTLVLNQRGKSNFCL